MKTLKKTLAIILTVIMTVTSIPMATGLVSVAADCSTEGHSYGEWSINIAPTCTKKGTETRFCSECGAQESRYTDMIEHSYTVEEIAPTCTKDGYTAYTCTVCGYIETDNKKDATGHNLGEWTTVKAATCTEKGEEARCCSNPGCSEAERRETDIASHDYEIIEVAPTCSLEGYVAYKCKVCPHYYITERISALGHSYGEWETVRESSCFQAGEKKRSCSTCGHIETEEILKLKHTNTVETLAPTCTEAGYTKYTCSVCGNVVVNNRKPIGHLFGSWEETKASSCTETGEEKRTCSACGKSETREKAKIGHKYIKEETAPTCTTIGTTLNVCSACGHSTTTYVPATGHKMSDWVEVTAPTCTAKGTDERKCEVCGGARETKEVPVLIHSYVAEYTPATCTMGSYTTYTCSACSDSYKVDGSGAKGHSDGNNDGTCDACGTSVPKKDPSADCDCMCHKDGFMGFVYKIISIFWKLFKSNQECECGVSHY